MTQRFGRWTVLAILPERRRYRKTSFVLWLCRCDCGTERVVVAADLRRGVSTSCGCFSREQTIKRNTKHGHSPRGRRTRAYARWCAMMARCFNPNATGYCNYGGRGIIPCEWWLKYENYYADTGDAPPGKSLDRIDNDGNYEPDNVRWATRTEQAHNRRPPKRRKRRRSTLLELQAYSAALARAGEQ